MIDRRTLMLGALAVCGGLTGSRLWAAGTGADRDAVVRRFSKLVRAEYQDEAKGRALADRILGKLASGAYENMDSAAGLARALMEDVSAVTHDRHFHVLEGMHHGGAPSIRPGVRQSQPDPARLEQIRADHFGIGGAEILPGNIGRIEVRQFYNPFAQVVEKIGSSMRLVADTEALVIDLTGCIGGDPAGVAHASSYFFERAPFVINRFHWRSSGVEEFRTTADLPAPNYGEKRPVVVAVSRDSFSAAEEFAYNLQALQRAVVVGEQTAGGANHAEMFPLGGDLVAFIPCARAENPVTGSNWEGRGVQPDIIVATGDIATAASQEARRRAKKS